MENKKTGKDRFTDWQLPEIKHGKLTRWNWVVYHPENFKLGKKTDIGAFTAIFAHYGVVIEDEVQIGSHCTLYSASTIDDKQGPVVLKKNCRVGSHCVVMPGVIIGENAIVGAQSFVNKDLPPNEVWAGSPVRFIMTLDDYSKKLKKRKKN
jgi:acetyltransferase-like isoleucine patch superfamily enzyme